MRAYRKRLSAVAVLVWAVAVAGTAVGPVAVGATTTTTTGAADLVRSDFEDGTNQGWGPSNNTVVTNDGSQARSGTRSLAVHSLAIGAGTQLQVPTAGLQPGQGYRVQGYARTADGQPSARIRAEVYADGRPLGVRRTAAPTGAWNLGGMLITGFTWPAGAYTLRLAVTVVGSCDGRTLPDELYLDDLSLVTGSPSFGLPDAECPATTTTTTSPTTTTTSPTTTTTSPTTTTTTPTTTTTTPTTTTTSPPTTTTTTRAPYCRVVYTVVSQWPQGFVGNLAVTNLSGTAWINWTLRWRFPGGQVITSGWNGHWTQAGVWITFTPSPWMPPVLSGTTVNVGFVASGSPLPPPTDFSVNGIPCNT